MLINIDKIGVAAGQAVLQREINKWQNLLPRKEKLLKKARKKYNKHLLRVQQRRERLKPMPEILRPRNAFTWSRDISLLYI